MSVNKFKVVSMDEDTITIYPDRALNMMDFYFDNNGDKIFKEILEEKAGKKLNVKYIDKKIKLIYKNDSSKNSLKSLREYLNIKKETKNVELKSEIKPKEIIEKTDNEVKPEYHLDEIMSQEEEYISDEELSAISNEIVLDDDIIDVDEDYDASIMEIFGAKEE